MTGRTPSFIVVGLVIIMFLLGFFYMSCSSKNTELRLSLEDFEVRIRALTLKNSEAEKKIDTLISRKRELEEEKITVQRQVEKKESEINDINTKLNEKNAEIQGLKSDKQALEQQIAEYKTMGETINSKNSLIEKLQQQINEQKQFGLSEQNRLKDEIEGLKHRLTSQGSQSTNNESVIVANERFAPRFVNNQTTRSMASLFQNPSDQSNNGSKQMRPEIVPVGVDISGKSLNVLGSNSSNNGSVESLAGSNVPAPPLNNDTRGAQQQAVNPIESAQAAPRVPRLGEQGGIADRNVPEGGARVAGSNNQDLQPIQDIDEMDEGDMFEDRPARNRAEEPAMRNNNPSENAMRAPANRGGLEENERIQPRLEEEGALGNRNRLSGRRKSLRRDRLLDNAAQAEQFGQEVPRRGLS